MHSTGLPYLQDVFRGKKVLIFGYGREGKSTEIFLKNYCEPTSIDIFEGSVEEIQEEQYDLIMKSPGIVMLERKEKYTSQTELFLNAFGEQTIGVTGTKGKSTTSAMLYKVLHECYEGDAILLGNIGLPCFDYAPSITEKNKIVFELSCHQLLHIDKAPHISIFLNLYEEHLDYYGDMQHYFDAKSHITTHQKRGDYLLVGENVPEMETQAKVIEIQNLSRNYMLRIPGEHNKLNAEFVFKAAALVEGTNLTLARESIESFEGLPHRLQYFATIEGVKYYDDSISTIPQATIQASASLPEAKTFLVGGMDRGIDYSDLLQYIKEHPELKFVLMYETGRKIWEQLQGGDNVFLVNDLQEAVRKAKEITEDGAVVLSPAAASYGYFKNFEERGEVFKELVRA